jgi:hypothetical protein
MFNYSIVIYGLEVEIESPSISNLSIHGCKTRFLDLLMFEAKTKVDEIFWPIISLSLFLTSPFIIGVM